MKQPHLTNRLGLIVMIISVIFVVALVLYTSYLAHLFAEEETQKMKIWAEATRQFIKADEDTDIDFVTSIIEENTTIPVYMLDSNGQILSTRNVSKPVENPKLLNGPIEVRVSEKVVQYIYYDESIYIQRLKYLPYVEFGIILLVAIIGVAAILITERSEQNRVWVGLSRETAHQLGTPISSLMAWNELLKMRYPYDQQIAEIQMDIDRLQTIAERFSKIGSTPELTNRALLPIVNEVVAYMQNRTSSNVTILTQSLTTDSDKWHCKMCAPLFKWVIENLIKNAVDAMNGVGTITISLTNDNHVLCLDIEDTGKGIERSRFKQVFIPGYSSKPRGWGLGLPLSKRIIEDYHGGKIFVKQSVIGQGTTFRILLKETENSGTTS